VRKVAKIVVVTTLRKLSKHERTAGFKTGDVVMLRDPRGNGPGTVAYGSGGYEVVKVGPQNVLVSSDVQFAPGGPVYHHEHRVPLHHVAAVALPSTWSPALPPGTSKG
jgi:predicted RNase H-like nuclease (RuvC/YqgF family)